MLFNSFQFVLFIIPVLGIYALLKQRRWQNPFLLAASYLFYGMWDWRFLSLILFSTIVDYFCGLKLEETEGPGRKTWLILSLCTNLGLLGVFKYYNFFAQSFEDLLETVGIEVSFTTLAIVLPVGISFYTFQTLSYTIDVYQGKTRATSRLWDFALYVAFFPQLVAGPIEKARRFLPQILSERKMTREGFYQGSYLVFWGLFKKVFVADNCALIVESVFRGDSDPTGFQYLIGAWAFSWQIYCDFSGYSDIAKGISQIMGFDLMWNFKMPYFSRNLSDFWRRWHISLSTWFKEYVYIPLGGNRVSKQRMALNLMIVFLVSGLWHGAAANFVVWGGLHGVGLVCLVLLKAPIERMIAVFPKRLWGWAAVFITFNYVALTFAVWQTETAFVWVEMLGQIAFGFDFSTRDLGTLGKLAGLVAVPMLIQGLQKRAEDPMVVMTWPVPARALLYAVLLFCMLKFGVFDGEQFIYFQF